MSDYITGKKYPNHKPSTSYSSGRICLHKQCETVLSKYNKYRYCNNHKPKVYPRIKGRDVPPDLQKPVE
jgi:hypothetical protein